MDRGATQELGETQRVCPSCEQHNGALQSSRYSRGQWRLKQCAECRLVYLENPPPTSALVDEYNWTATSHMEAQRRLGAQPLLARLRYGWKQFRLRWLKSNKLNGLIRHYAHAGKLLDVGCGNGSHFSRLPPDVIPHGIEIDAAAIGAAQKMAAARGGRAVHADALSGLRQFESGSMDCIVMHSFLEHEVEPLAVLREARRVVRPAGVIIIKVPNYACWSRRFIRRDNWPGFRFPDHVNYFTPGTLRQIVSQSGLHVRRFSWWDRLPTSDNMWLVANA